MGNSDAEANSGNDSVAAAEIYLGEVSWFVDLQPNQQIVADESLSRNATENIFVQSTA